MGSKRLNDLHPLDDNNTQEALDGLLKAVEKALEERTKNQRNKIMKRNEARYR
ncbi:hypothetical protein ABEX28_08840 [Bacillus tropicus]|uniref:hypothetical protein n=1 Tax=Bacillus tropicus TaxID=2026188 RepID=UPI003D20F930